MLEKLIETQTSALGQTDKLYNTELVDTEKERDTDRQTNPNFQNFFLMFFSSLTDFMLRKNSKNNRVTTFILFFVNSSNLQNFE